MIRQHFPSSIAFLAIPFVLAQCTTSHVKMDHMHLREVLMDYTEEQIVDNVIRARNSMPIMHFDMDHVDAVVKTSVNASVGGGKTRVTERSRSRSADIDYSESESTYGSYSPSTSFSSGLRTTLGLATGIVSTVTKPFSWAASGGRDNTVDVQMTPVLDENAVYEAYEKFVSINGGDSVRDSRRHPIPDPKVSGPDDPDGVHVGKKWRGVYYWVPNKYKKEFFKLCIAAAVKRDARTAVRSRESDGLRQTASEIRRLRLY